MKNRKYSKRTVKNVEEKNKDAMNLRLKGIACHVSKDILLNKIIRNDELKNTIVKGIDNINTSTSKLFNAIVVEFLIDMGRDKNLNSYIRDCRYINHSSYDEVLLLEIILCKLVNKIDNWYDKFSIIEDDKILYVSRAINSTIRTTNFVNFNDEEKDELYTLEEKIKRLSISEVMEFKRNFVQHVNRLTYVTIHKNTSNPMNLKEIYNNLIDKCLDINGKTNQLPSHIDNSINKMFNLDEVKKENEMESRTYVIHKRDTINKLEYEIRNIITHNTIVSDFIKYSEMGINYFIKSIRTQIMNEDRSGIRIDKYITSDICKLMGEYIVDRFDFVNDLQLMLTLSTVMGSYMQVVINAYDIQYSNKRPNVSLVNINSLIDYLKDNLKFDLIRNLKVHIELSRQQLMCGNINNELNFESLIANIVLNLNTIMQGCIEGEEDNDLSEIITAEIFSFVFQNKLMPTSVYRYEDGMISVYGKRFKTAPCSIEEVEEINYFIEKYYNSGLRLMIDEFFKEINKDETFVPLRIVSHLFKDNRCENLLKAINKYVDDNFIYENKFERNIAQKSMLIKIIHPLVSEPANESNKNNAPIDSSFKYTKAIVDSIFQILDARKSEDTYRHFDSDLRNIVGVNSHRIDTLFRKLFNLKHIKEGKIKIIDFISYVLI